MKRELIAGSAMAGLIVVFTLGALQAQQHPAEHQQGQTKAAASEEGAGTVF